VKKCVIVPMWSRQLYATERRPLYLLNVLFYFLCLSLFKAVVNSAAVNLHSRSFSRVVALAPIEALSWGALHSKTGRDRSRQLRLWLVERRDRSWFCRPVLNLQRGPGVSQKCMSTLWSN